MPEYKPKTPAVVDISKVEGSITEIDGFEDVNQYGFVTIHK